MSMLLWSDPFSNYYCRLPSQILDQSLGLGIDPEYALTQNLLNYPQGLLQSANENAISDVTFDKDKFQVNIDVQHFKPEEITVRVTGDDNTITVEGKHEEKQDEHGFISRHFVRKYVLPKEHDINRVESKLSTDGVLTITAPKVQGEGANKERNIPIKLEGKLESLRNKLKDKLKIINNLF